MSRRPATWWLLVGLVAVATGWTVHQQYARAVDQQLAWGTQARVVVALENIDVGESIASATELRAWPAAVVPDGALDHISVGGVARVRIVTGELVLAERVSSGRSGGLVDLLPVDTVAVGVPVGPGTPPLSVGDRVDLLATFNRSGDEPDTARVATEAVVVDVTDDVVTVAIANGEVADTASALSRAAVTIALTGR